MTNQQILEKAIQKAISGGWLPHFALFDNNMTKDTILIRYTEGDSSVNFDYQVPGHIIGVGGYSLEPFSIIFNHDFAKALWGDEHSNCGCNLCEGGCVCKWEFHLREMVIAEDPIKYLGENI